MIKGIITRVLIGAITLVGFTAHAGFKATKKIAIVDTGYSERYISIKPKLCKTGHYDFALAEATVGEPHGPHGSFIAGIIAEELEDEDYCLIIYQVDTGEIDLLNIMRAINMAAKEGAVAINISIVGPLHHFLEKATIQKVVARGATVFVAAGNNNMNLDEVCNSYPGCYNLKNVLVVGALSPDLTQKAAYSNYGSIVKLWYPGTIRTKQGYSHGTSYAAPAALADYVRNLR